MSAEFRRKLLLGEVRMTKTNKEILAKYNVDASAGTTLLLVKNGEGEENVIYNKGKFTFNKVRNFLQKHALKEAVTGPVKKVKKETTEENTGTKKEL